MAWRPPWVRRCTAPWSFQWRGDAAMLTKNRAERPERVRSAEIEDFIWFHKSRGQILFALGTISEPVQLQTSLLFREIEGLEERWRVWRHIGTASSIDVPRLDIKLQDIAGQQGLFFQNWVDWRLETGCTTSIAFDVALLHCCNVLTRASLGSLVFVALCGTFSKLSKSHYVPLIFSKTSSILSIFIQLHLRASERASWSCASYRRPLY